MNKFYFLVCILLYVADIILALPTTIQPEPPREVCERDLIKCVKDYGTKSCYGMFAKCIKDNYLPQTEGVFDPSKNDLILNFKCCFKDMTNCFVNSKENITMIGMCSYKMIKCTVLNNKNYKNQTNPRNAWVNDAPLRLKTSVMSHFYCNSRYKNGYCCSRKYQEQVEIMMVTECFHRLLQCQFAGNSDVFCRQEFKKCFYPDCKECTQCDTGYYSSIPAEFATSTVNSIRTCEASENTERFIQCVFNLRVKGVPEKEIRREYCARSLEKSNLLGKAELTQYEACMRTTKTIEFSTKDCASSNIVNALTR